MIDEAKEVVNQRRATYGSPLGNFSTIAELWNSVLRRRFGLSAVDFDLTPLDVAQLMRLVKEARLAETPNHKDSLLDIVGYVDCAETCARETGEVLK